MNDEIQYQSWFCGTYVIGGIVLGMLLKLSGILVEFGSSDKCGKLGF